MKAVILAAGTGRRLQPLTNRLPKCLLPIAGETFLQRQLRILGECDVADVTMVVGHCADDIMRRIGDTVRYVGNPLHLESNSIASLHLALQVPEASEGDLLVLNSDVLFTRDQLASLIEKSWRHCLLVDSSEPDDEATKVLIMDDHVQWIGTQLPKSHGRVQGEYLGIAKIRADAIVHFKYAVERTCHVSAGSKWPEAFRHLMSHGHPVHWVLALGDWIEVDTLEDYSRAIQMFPDKEAACARM